MDFIFTLLSPVIWLLGAIFSVVWWVFFQLLWIALWLVLPVLVVAYVAFRIAESVIGKEPVRAWLKAKSARMGGGIWDRARRGLVASSVLPFRVFAWFFVYAIWHSIISLFWTPRWRPWQRAWAKRWRPDRPIPSSPLPATRKV